MSEKVRAAAKRIFPNADDSFIKRNYNDISFIASQTNFILLPLGEVSSGLRDGLLKDGIIVRLLRFRGKGIIRITVGLPEENSLLREKFMKNYVEAKNRQK